MKILKVLIVCIVLMGSTHFDADAQAARNIWKVGKELIKKTPKKKKTTPKKSIKTGSKVDAPIVVNCPRCNGAGNVTIWNPQFRVWQSVNCANCNGLGKVRK